MSKINRIETDDFWADSTVIEAGNFVYTSYCMKNEGKPIETKFIREGIKFQIDAVAFKE